MDLDRASLWLFNVIFPIFVDRRPSWSLAKPIILSFFFNQLLNLIPFPGTSSQKSLSKVTTLKEAPKMENRKHSKVDFIFFPTTKG